MRRVISLVSILVVLMVSMAMGISAQDATPPGEAMGPPESFEIAPGVVADNMVFAEGEEAPVRYRLSFESGVVYPVEPSANLELIYAESGSLVMTFDTAVAVGRIGDVVGGEVVPAGTEFTLEAGQFLVLQPGVSGEVRNDGTETAAVVVAGLNPAGAGAPEDIPASTPVG